ncbi:hypothetical protein EAO77_36100 [Streptomyces sp. t39]|nr:hypothetical protein EAO77_36100 [Streptomyces sp. t39]
MIADDQFRAELELCDRWGIPHSQFIGAGDGTWTVRDREKALAYQAYQRTVCPQCGTRDDDWDHGGDDGEDQYAVTVQKCVGCEVIADKQKDLERDGTSLHGIKVGLMPAAVHAALQVEREARRRRRRDDDNE